MPSDYKIPEEVLSKIPEGFYTRFVIELEMVFGEGVIERTSLACLQGTLGWCGALKASCEAFDMMWLYDYCRRLHWWERDRFDDELLELIKEKHGIKRSEKLVSDNETSR